MTAEIEFEEFISLDDSFHDDDDNVYRIESNNVSFEEKSALDNQQNVEFINCNKIKSILSENTSINKPKNCSTGSTDKTVNIRIVLISIISLTFSFLKVQDILTSTADGILVIDFYKQKGILSPANRTFIVRKVIQYYIENLEEINVVKCRELAQQIVSLFPTECLVSIFQHLFF